MNDIHLDDIPVDHIIEKARLFAEQWFWCEVYEGDDDDYTDLIYDALIPFEDGIGWNICPPFTNYTAASTRLTYLEEFNNVSGTLRLFILQGEDQDSYCAFVAYPANISGRGYDSVIFCNLMILEFNLSQSDQTIIQLSNNSRH